MKNETKRTKVQLANLIPGLHFEPPDFPPPMRVRGWQMIAARKSGAGCVRNVDLCSDDPRLARQWAEGEFHLFLDKNFPREKFGELRDELDRASTPVQFYRSIVEARRLLRSAAIIMDWHAREENRCPALRLCAVCGRIFPPQRKDRMICMDRCGNRERQQRKRWLAEVGNYEGKSQQRKGQREYDEKQKLKAKGAA